MPIVIKPGNCAKCRQPLQANYQDRRQARMPWRGRVVLITSIFITLVSFPAILFFAASAVIALGQALGMLPARTQPIDDACLFGLPAAFLPGMIGWWYAFRLPRLMPIPCRQCGHVQVCSIRETNESPGESTAPVPGSTATAYVVGDVNAADRLERAKNRKKKAASQASEEEPNPDFDFDKPDVLQSEQYPPDNKPPPAAGTSDAIEAD